MFVVRNYQRNLQLLLPITVHLEHTSMDAGAWAFVMLSVVGCAALLVVRSPPTKGHILKCRAQELPHVANTPDCYSHTKRGPSHGDTHCNAN